MTTASKSSSAAPFPIDPAASGRSPIPPAANNAATTASQTRQRPAQGGREQTLDHTDYLLNCYDVWSATDLEVRGCQNSGEVTG
jgi:hypothetical protein|tara:strand:- start:71 stop:322 length:252 start_codon:yes stop_codon:yes gene_type:complete